MAAAGICGIRRLRRTPVVVLTLEMPQWLLGIFAAYLVVAIAVVIARAFKPKNATCSVVDAHAPSGAFFARSVVCQLLKGVY